MNGPHEVRAYLRSVGLDGGTPGLARRLLSEVERRQLEPASPALARNLRALTGAKTAREMLRELDRSTQPLSPRADASPPHAAGARGEASGIIDALLERLGARHDFEQRYEVLEELGKGGMGRVHRVRDRILQRILARKTPRSAADQHVFVHEAVISAGLDHPGIPPVHEFGVHEERPYFVMKLVEGAEFGDIAAQVHAQHDGWSLHRAVGVVRRICEAVAHAHDRGVIHRDIQPRNVYVQTNAEPFVIDWGLARILRPLLWKQGGNDLVPADERIPTYSEKRLRGVLPFVAPEITDDGRAADERSDIYSLGALLYLLLAGSAPFCDPIAAQSPPSTPDPELSAPRPTPITMLNPGAPAALVLICETALAPAPEARHQSARRLAQALGDYLEDASELGRRERQARKESDQVARFLISTFEAIDPVNAQGRTVDLRVLLDRAASRLLDEPEPLDRPGTDLAYALGRIYLRLTPYEQGVALLRRAYDVRRELYGPEDERTLVAATELGHGLDFLGDHTAAIELLRDTLRNQHRLRGGELRQDTMLTTFFLAEALHKSGHREEALPLYERALRGQREVLGHDDPDTLNTMHSLAQLLDKMDFGERALEIMRTVHETWLHLDGPDHKQTLITATDLGGMLRDTDLLAQTLERQTNVLGRDHPDTLTTMSNLAGLLMSEQRIDEAGLLLEEADRRLRLLKRPAHNRMVSVQTNLCQYLLKRDRAPEAERCALDALENARLSQGADPLVVARLKHYLGRAEIAQERADDALVRLAAVFEDYVAEGRRAAGFCNELRLELAELHEQRGDRDRARAMRRRNDA